MGYIYIYESHLYWHKDAYPVTSSVSASLIDNKFHPSIYEISLIFVVHDKTNGQNSMKKEYIQTLQLIRWYFSQIVSGICYGPKVRTHLKTGFPGVRAQLDINNSFYNWFGDLFTVTASNNPILRN